ncbi:phospholipase [Phormidium sp. FACHB-592]|jgi:phosphatidylserine/phosphatidylglycerophosphate/cardiolipin synthase-like enzyme|uniref:DISARM system phospholipase D-like protein DrmC n=1 Tax=Stenomitos frigidus AS-A4 TaxID=2933935 RepID=A0ABV0KQL6_9CYAN|nr:DISARM system phospholipase D-like protein DrmC [Phormidium sp. FACHB-592]MBD2073042.1 phospholipase [Phormidium sp. FACHB-592]
MISPLMSLSRPALTDLATALETERFSFPIYPFALASYVPEQLAGAIAAELNQLRQQGMSSAHMAYMLKLLTQERAIAQQKQEQTALVWTGPEVLGAESRDTAVVVRELFSSARHSVLLSSFAIDQGAKGYELFRPLANRMDANPTLNVRMFLNVKRQYTTTTPTSDLLRQFAETFRKYVWPGQRLPEVFHDPRALELSTHSNACLHAKCVVVDEERVFITSANFTEAAHQRNIEAGVLLSNRVTARAIRSQFEMLVTQKILQRVPGL